MNYKLARFALFYGTIHFFSSVSVNAVIAADTKVGSDESQSSHTRNHLTGETVVAQDKPQIAVFSGARATIQNTVPLVTSNKAREKYGLGVLKNPNGTAARFDHLVPQRLAVPAEVYIEVHSAHPLEKDAAELYAPPDGYVDEHGRFFEDRQDKNSIPVYRVTLQPKDGLYLLPYMARQHNGEPWEGDCVKPGAAAEFCRQPFFPDAARLFEEIDRGMSGLATDGKANVLSAKADFDFYRVIPPAGYKKGLLARERTDVGSGDIPREKLGKDFFPYRPYHLRAAVPYQDLAKVTNVVQQTLATGKYKGAIWLEASTRVEETIYWLNLLIDTSVPIVGNAASGENRALSADGPANIVDSVDYIASESWMDSRGRDRFGVVLINGEQIFTARQVQKTDARPGGYRATGDHGGVIGTMGKPGDINMYFKPLTRHTWRSEVNISRLPESVEGVLKVGNTPKRVSVIIKDKDGMLQVNAIPRVTLVKDSHFNQESERGDPESEVEILARVEKNLDQNPLAGFVVEGSTPYGNMSNANKKALEMAAFSGMPIVRVGRGDVGGVTAVNEHDVFIEGNNLTATKARLLLMACMMKYGSLPVAKDPQSPTMAETEAIWDEIRKYQEVFDQH
jgi:L-asparaginase/Glu-tRNA(Gln) amidotransferase subunit D